MDGLLLRTLLTGALIAVGVAAPAQTASKDAVKPPANAWMLSPTPYGAWNQDISPALRAQRDRFWDDSAPQRLPLTAPNPDPMSVNSGNDGPIRPEILDLPHRVVLTGTFVKHRSVLSASEMSLYTEVTIHVDEVFEDKSGSGLPFPSKEITLLFSGGAVTLRTGRTLYYHTGPQELFLEPNHKYLLVLSYHDEGDFYQYVDDWDISTGTVRANTDRTQYLAREGRSSLDGLTVQQLGSALDKLFYRRD